MLKILGDFIPYGKEFIGTYPHLAECSQSNSTRSLKATDFTKILEQQNLRRSTIPPPVRTEQSYQLSSTPAPASTALNSPTTYLQDFFPVDEELYVQNNTVIWSRGRHIIKTFQYELQPVERVLFAWFPIDQLDCEDSVLSIDQLITNRKRKATTLDNKATAKRKHYSTLSFDKSFTETADQNKYGISLDDRKTLLPPLTRKDNTGKRLEKAACIILKDCVKIHFLDGKYHSIHLPFTVHHVIPSDIGLILERTIQYNNNTVIHKGKNKNPFTSRYSEPSSTGGLSVSPFLCLAHPAEEFKPIFFFDQPTFVSNDPHLSVDFFQQQQLVYASFTADHPNDHHDSPATLVVTKSKNTGTHSVWRYQMVSRSELEFDSSDDEMLEKSKSYFQKTPSFSLDTRQSKQDQSDHMRKQGRRTKKTQFGMKGSKRGQRQQKQQVSPDSHFGGGGGGGNNSSSILYHSPSPSPSLTSRKDSFLAGSQSFMQGDEDVSALSMVFSGDNNSMMALYQNALNDKYGEKCQLEHLWTEDRRSNTNTTVVSRAFLSHNAQGLLVLCIMDETEGTLIGLVVKDLLSSKHDIMNAYTQLVTGFHMHDVRQALPIYNATRSGNVADILLLDHNDNLSIFVDSQIPCLPIMFSNKDQQQYNIGESQLIKIHDAVDNRFNLVLMEKDKNGTPIYKTKRCQIVNITSGEFYHKSSNRALVTSSSMALQCAWSSTKLWALFQQQSLLLQKQQQDHCLDGWESFVTTLISMIPLVPLFYSTSTTNDKKKIGSLYENCMINAYRLQKEPQNQDISYYITDPQNIALAIYSLHALNQDYHLSKFFPKTSVSLLGTLLWVLARIVNSSSWINCYCKYDFLLEVNIPYQLDITLLEQDYQQKYFPIEDGLIFLERPFLFESWMHYHLPHNFTTSLSQLFGLPTLDPELPPSISTQDRTLITNTSSIASINNKIQRKYGGFGFRLKMLWYIHHTMHFYLSNVPPSQPISSSLPLNAGRQKWIEAIVKKGYRRNDLEMVPDTCILLAPLLNTLDYLQSNPSMDQTMDFYRFIGRNDIVAQLDPHQVSSVVNNATNDFKSAQFFLDKKHNISQLIGPSTANDTDRSSGNNTIRSPRTYGDDSTLDLAQFFYGNGTSTLDTLKHVRQMLNPCHIVEMVVPDQSGISQENVDLINQGYLKDLMQRTLALPIGNGVFHYGHQHAPASRPSLQSPLPAKLNNDDTENANRPLVTIEEAISMSAKLLPLRRTVEWDDKSYRPEYFEWPRFHHGVATALRLSSPRLSLSGKNRNVNGIGNAATLSPSKIQMAPASTGSSDYLDDDDDKNDLSWLFYVEPEELNVFHGGLLFGLGLNGHLLPNLHWYRYITQSRCSLVTIGFILGTCVTFRGSKNTDIIKILSVHVPELVASQTATVVTNSVDNVGGATSLSGRMPGKDDDLMTSSCLFGLGLIFLGSCDRYMTTVMLNEIGNCSKRADVSCGSGGGGRPVGNMESASALAAGFALGFIMLGKGGNTSKELGGLPDAQLFDTLYNYMTGKTTNVNYPKSEYNSEQQPTSPQQQQQQQHRKHKQQQGKGTQVHYSQGMSSLLDITTPAATIALGLAYLKTENHRIAERLDISDTTKPYLNYVRPDFLLLRVVAKNLILWQSITPSQDWIDGQLPAFMHFSQRDQDLNYTGNSFDESMDGMEEQVINQAKYNIVAGACLCLGLRFAGTQDPDAFNCLLDHFDTFMKLAVGHVTTFQDHVTKSAVWVCIDVIATAAAMVMAGSGHEELYKRLKILHDRIPFGGGTTGNGKYSNHMASHMALGLLFCGLGRYTLKTTNEAIAGLLCSFYPFYPTDSEDQRSHLQAFRHLWMMGLDQRWLTPIDCDTKQPCHVPLLLTTNSLSTVPKDAASEDIITSDINSSMINDNNSEFGIPLENNPISFKDNHKRSQDICRVVAPSVVPSFDTLSRIELDSSLYYPINVNMQTKGDYQQALRQSGILFVQRKKAQ